MVQPPQIFTHVVGQTMQNIVKPVISPCFYGKITMFHQNASDTQLELFEKNWNFMDFPRNIVYKWRVFAHRFLDLLDEAWAGCIGMTRKNGVR